MKVILNTGEASEMETTLAEFLLFNELDCREEDDIAAALDRGDTYHGGGGAAAEWSIRAADA